MKSFGYFIFLVVFLKQLLHLTVESVLSDAFPLSRNELQGSNAQLEQFQDPQGMGSVMLDLSIYNRDEDFYVTIGTSDGQLLCAGNFSRQHLDGIRCPYDKSILQHGNNTFHVVIYSLDRQEIILETTRKYVYHDPDHSDEVRDSDGSLMTMLMGMFYDYQEPVVKIGLAAVLFQSASVLWEKMINLIAKTRNLEAMVLPAVGLTSSQSQSPPPPPPSTSMIMPNNTTSKPILPAVKQVKPILSLSKSSLRTTKSSTHIPHYAGLLLGAVFIGVAKNPFHNTKIHYSLPSSSEPVGASELQGGVQTDAPNESSGFGDTSIAGNGVQLGGRLKSGLNSVKHVFNNVCRIPMFVSTEITDISAKTRTEMRIKQANVLNVFDNIVKHGKKARHGIGCKANSVKNHGVSLIETLVISLLNAMKSTHTATRSVALLSGAAGSGIVQFMGDAALGTGRGMKVGAALFTRALLSPLGPLTKLLELMVSGSSKLSSGTVEVLVYSLLGLMEATQFVVSRSIRASSLSTQWAVLSVAKVFASLSKSGVLLSEAAARSVTVVFLATAKLIQGGGSAVSQFTSGVMEWALLGILGGMKNTHNVARSVALLSGAAGSGIVQLMGDAALGTGRGMKVGAALFTRALLSPLGPLTKLLELMVSGSSKLSSGTFGALNHIFGRFLDILTSAIVEATVTLNRVSKSIFVVRDYFCEVVRRITRFFIIPWMIKIRPAKFWRTGLVLIVNLIAIIIRIL